jgi:cytochrome c oxidase cbb3-type subunit 2
MHLYNPREVSGDSIMPSYGILFHDRRGNDLVAYLSSLRPVSGASQIAAQQQWHLPSEAVSVANPADGPALYKRYCATCHNADGPTRLKWQSQFIESPAILAGGPARSAALTMPQPAQIDHFAQIIKFGIPASDMAGHEYLPDRDIASLSVWLAQNTAQPSPAPAPHSTSHSSGDEQ